VRVRAVRNLHGDVGNANVTVQISHSADANGISFFDTEMLQLDLTAPVGAGVIMIRESPTLVSTGQATLRGLADGYMASSFFDVNTELSTDGFSWVPAQN